MGNSGRLARLKLSSTMDLLQTQCVPGLDRCTEFRELKITKVVAEQQASLSIPNLPR